MVYNCDKCGHVVLGKDASWHRATPIIEDDLDGLVLKGSAEYVVLRKSDKANWGHKRIFYADAYSSRLFNGNGINWHLVGETAETTGPAVREKLADDSFRQVTQKTFDKVCAKLMEFFADKYFSTIFKRTVPEEAE